ncbi:MAG: hypothetical protein QOJ91_785 [Sphingomonadales bacterium]|jgi:hypothetical protein|nr:hypothetical protein [Sphingomonadales bacterium]
MSDRDPSELRGEHDYPPAEEAAVHVYGKRIVCATEDPGRPRNRKLAINEIVVGSGNGTIPLWAAGVTLYWRFRERAFRGLANPDGVKDRIRLLLHKALDLWGDARPVDFAERDSGWDFEITLRNSDDCNAVGCVLASAFFPDGGQHRLTIYPKMLEQEEEEQIETLVHELGHVFGLRHFFAQLSETQLPSEIFGTHVDFTIMNYGEPSILTEADRSDLIKLYQLARSGQLTAINGTRIVLVKPFSTLGG